LARTEWQALIDQIHAGRGRKITSEDGFPEHNLADRVEFAPGLTDAEVDGVENRYGFRFPPDLRDFLQVALPSGEDFPDWRNGDESVLRDWLEVPLDGILFDVEYNRFWLEEWGQRPTSLEEALKVTTELVRAAPRLIPIFGHRMMPDEPHLPGNPVFSVHQTDIIYYGFDLADYLRHEFHLPGREDWPEQDRPIRFWDIKRFLDVRWGPDGMKPNVFDNSEGWLP
jgi:hypothetical protein